MPAPPEVDPNPLNPPSAPAPVLDAPRTPLRLLLAEPEPAKGAPPSPLGETSPPPVALPPLRILMDDPDPPSVVLPLGELDDNVSGRADETADAPASPGFRLQLDG